MKLLLTEENKLFTIYLVSMLSSLSFYKPVKSILFCTVSLIYVHIDNGLLNLESFRLKSLYKIHKRTLDFLHDFQR